MNLNRFVRLITLVLPALLACFDHASAQGNAFTYQGRLNDNGGPASGLYDLEFTLYGGPAGGNVLAGLTNASTSVSNGAFIVTLDFGPGSFPGADRWLEIGARTNGANTLTVLSPRQQFTPTPYAITAANVSSGGLPGGTYSSAFSFSNSSNTFSGTFFGNGAGLSNVSAQTVGGLSSSSFWQLNGNLVAPGHFLGSSNNQPL